MISSVNVTKSTGNCRSNPQEILQFIMYENQDFYRTVIFEFEFSKKIAFCSFIWVIIKTFYSWIVPFCSLDLGICNVFNAISLT